ncbi:glucose dehydrogenase [FAD, quinone]-like [Neodiprion pinetum]|uniref:glucose dehydrogenase [FAD, quinone]-like n=1 Tax=Neodiprion pinetum TaxID=441929 RepID=UPI001EDFFEDF|nr:glucose dehydrogenase [FAD, quinone]-like [Neodiprion pinetum]XP_046487552.1 glucose dehydrogenase [FAD, quinone]-like [Neodiprion pinetum]
MTYSFSPPSTCNVSLPGPTFQSLCNASAILVFMSLLDEFTRVDEKVSGICERITSIKEPADVYDYIVIGGGGAGSVVAARLSEVQNVTVLVLEAGDDESAVTQIPSLTLDLIGSEIDWNYDTSNETNCCMSTNGSCSWSGGRSLGGSTVITGMTYARGNPTDFDNWAAMGNEGWSYKDVLPFFLKSEDNGEIDRVGSEYHATGGPLSVERFPYQHPLGYTILQAAIQSGFGVSNDLNGEKRTGFSIPQATQKKGVRRSSARAFLWPARNRKNLDVSLNSYVTKVVVENDRAVGVEYYKNGDLKTVKVNREVILSSGAIKTPHILLHSGIGPKDHLTSFGIDVVKDLPGVGMNLHDQPGFSIPFTVNEPDVYYNNWATATEYLAFQTGPLSSATPIEITSALASNETTDDHPDIQIYPTISPTNCAPGEIDALQSTGKQTITFTTTYTHVKSRGRISLASNNPFQDPIIWANYLDDDRDVNGLLQGIEHILRLADTEAFKAQNFTMAATVIEACSNFTFPSSEYWACAVRQDTVPQFHQVGSCKMGPSSDPLAVVDSQLRVHGITGLRVADASIMPQVTSANVGAPTIMIGERAADFIKKAMYSTDCSKNLKL